LSWEVDEGAVVRQFGGDAGLAGEVAGLFVEDAPRLLGELREAVGRGDARGVERAAHALKGSVGYFGVGAVTEAAAGLERMGREGELGGAGEALAGVEAGVRRLMGALAGLAGRVNA
jgi:HPt (histidine-containing phosphotransfer) domain-containing protein